jgi:hypothetical protein
MSGQYCLDANIFITAWNSSYPMKVFPSLWEHLAQYRNDLVLIKPVFDEIDPISSADKKLPKNKKREKYPLRVWMIDNHFDAKPITDEINSISLELEKEYETNNNPKGANQNDITLIAHAKVKEKIVVTCEEEQTQKPGKKKNYKIPLICNEQGVEWIKFVTMLDRLGIRI